MTWLAEIGQNLNKLFVNALSLLIILILMSWICLGVISPILLLLLFLKGC